MQLETKVLASFILAGIMAIPAYADFELEEVVVTAQRREENLQNVPVSITAFTANQIQMQNLTEAKDYLQMTPNVSFTEDGETGQRAVGISIRGVSDLGNTFTGVGGLSNSFGIYLDEFNIANNATKTANPQMQDLERLEVLRGPQGTYFGRNATGGALNLSTKLPNEKFEYEFGAGWSRFNTWEVESVVNIPVTDELFVRAVAFYEESDGFLTNLSRTGSTDAYEHINFRVAARWVPSEQFTADFSVMRTVENDGTDSNVNTGISDFDTPGSTPTILQIDPDVQDVFAIFPDVFPVDSGAGFFPENRRIINKDFYEFNRGRSTILNLRLNYEGENWTVRSITGLMETTTHRQFDQDLVQHSLYETYSGRSGETFSEEIRFNLEGDNWDLTIGGLYAKDNSDNYGVSPIGSNDFFFVFDPSTALNPDGTIAPGVVEGGCFCAKQGFIISGPFVNYFDAKSYAVFAEINWQLSDQLKLTAGVRYTDDKIEVTETDLQGVPFALQPLNDYRRFKVYTENDPFVARYLNGTASFDAITPRVVVNWSPTEELNAYATISNGYKPGGLTFNERFGTTVPFLKELMWNYEAGVKWRGLDNRVQVNAAVFFMDWEDLQVPSVEIQIVDNVILNNFRLDNIAAESKGFELEMQGLVTEQFLIGGGVGYLDATFQEFGANDPFVINNMGFELDGATLPRSPEWTINLFAQYDFNMGEMPAWIRAEWTYRSATTSDIEAVVSALPILNNAVTQERGLFTQFNGTGFGGSGVAFPWPRGNFPAQVPSYDVLNLRAGLSNERWSINVYVENVFDKNYYTGTQENFGLGGFRVRPHFREAGIKLRLFSE